MFKKSAWRTLSSHRGGWLAWTEFANSLNSSKINPPREVVREFFFSLREGAAADRSSRRCKRPRAVWSALKFVAHLLDVPPLKSLVSSKVVESWLDPGIRRAKREAVPLPLFLLFALERTFLSSRDLGQQLVLGGLLAMVWGGLRCSDLMRSDPKELSIADGILRGFTWRSKCDSNGFAFAFVACGLCGSCWAEKWLSALDEWRKRLPSKVLPDFLVPSSQSGGPTVCLIHPCWHSFGRSP